MAIDFKARLKKLSKKWNDARTAAKAGGAGTPLQPGNYIAQLQSAKIDQKGDKNWLHVAFKFKIVKGDDAGATVYRNNGLEGDRSLEFVAGDLRRLGQDIDQIDLEDLESVLETVAESKPVVRLRLAENAKSDWPDVYIQKLVEMDESEFDAPGAGGGKADGEGEAAEASFEPGDDVLAGTKEDPGTIKSIDADDKTAMVKLESGKVKEFSFDDLKKAGEPEAETEAVAFEEGEAVKFKGKDATIKSIDMSDSTAMIKLADGSKKEVSLDDLEKADEAEAGDASAEFEIGDAVLAGDKEDAGTIKSLDADDKTAMVKLESGKTKEFSFDDLKKAEGDEPKVGDAVIIEVGEGKSKKDTPGTVKAVNAKKKTATVKFKDGKTAEVAFADVFFAQN